MPGPMFEKVASGWTYSANERFRGGRRVRLVIGALLSVAAHVVPFVYWPDWISLTRPVAPKATILQIEWLSIL